MEKLVKKATIELNNFTNPVHIRQNFAGKYKNFFIVLKSYYIK